MACTLAESPRATLCIESSDSFVASAAVSIATGWSEPVPGRELHPLKSSAFSRRTFSPTTTISADAKISALHCTVGWNRPPVLDGNGGIAGYVGVSFLAGQICIEACTRVFIAGAVSFLICRLGFSCGFAHRLFYAASGGGQKGTSGFHL